MKAPFQIVPINEAVVRVIDAHDENVAVMPTRPAARLIELVNTIPALTAALKRLTISAWNSSDESLLDAACSGEEAMRLVEPAFALCFETQGGSPVCVDCESSPYAVALKSCDCSPVEPSAGVEGVPG